MQDVEVLTENIFQEINPKIAVVTTPNRDFNQYFPNPEKFRHFDHRFEWTRKEFAEWCGKVCEAYEYSVEITGVGLPSGYDKWGFCSQIAVFQRKTRKTTRKSPSGHFEIIRHSLVPSNFPVDFFYKFYNDLLYSINVARNWENLDYSDGILVSEVFKVPSINILCDGSMFRLTEMIGKIMDLHPDKFVLENNRIFIKYDEISEEEL